MQAYVPNTDSIKVLTLSLVLIGPDEKRRSSVARAFQAQQAVIAREFSLYPAVDDVTELLQDEVDGVLVDLDSNPELALDVVENICAFDASIPVMVYSAMPNQDLLVRCMRAGAREFLKEPVMPQVAGEALVRAAARRDEMRRQKRVSGKLLVFIGAKGGGGVTTLATNFAVAVAGYARSVLLDLNLRLGDAALTLGLTPRFTVLDALENLNRLDGEFLDGLMVKHASGLAVLSAPDQVVTSEQTVTAMARLVQVARERYEYVIVDSGPLSVQLYGMLFDSASTVYLVTQANIAELRNANRLIKHYFNGPETEKLEIVLNRYSARNLEIDEDAVTKALMQRPKWRIPSDYTAVNRAQNSGVALVHDRNDVARALQDMAAAATGRAAALPNKKKRLGLFGM